MNDSNPPNTSQELSIPNDQDSDAATVPGAADDLEIAKLSQQLFDLEAEIIKKNET